MTKSKNTIIFVIVFFFLFIFFYRYSPRRIEFLGHYHKVFAHRVNSLEKQKQALKYFNGIELDLDYIKDKDVLDVNHPPAKTINLTFEKYLTQIDAGEYPFLWLDIKGLKISNKDKILKRLNTLFESKNYPKNKILIETPFPEALPDFTLHGYKTSYYLKSKMHEFEKEELIKELNIINSILEQQPDIGISSHYDNYELLKTNFPNKTKYLWAITSFYDFEFFKVRAALKDEKVEIVLTKFRSIKGNR